MKNVLIIGGTGLIGTALTNLFLKHHNSGLKVYIGSRAKQGVVNGIVIDINNERTFKNILLHKIDWVVMCTLDSQHKVLKYCIKNRVHYFDIANPTNKLKDAYQIASHLNVNSLVIFSSGWMGGIIPALIKSTVAQKEKIESVDIYIYYSSKDNAGSSSANFVAENINTNFTYFKNDKQIKTYNFINPRRYNFPFGMGNKCFYDFDIPDLYILNSSQSVPSVRAKISYDSNTINFLLYVFQKLKIFRLLPIAMRKRFFSVSGKGDTTSFSIACNTDSSKSIINLEDASGQAHLTSWVVYNFLSHWAKFEKPGIYFSYELPRLEEILTNFKSTPSISIFQEC